MDFPVSPFAVLTTPILFLGSGYRNCVGKVRIDFWSMHLN